MNTYRVVIQVEVRDVEATNEAGAIAWVKDTITSEIDGARFYSSSAEAEER